MDNFGFRSWKFYIFQKCIAGQSKFFRQFQTHSHKYIQIIENIYTKICLKKIWPRQVPLRKPMIEVTNFRKLASLSRFYNYCRLQPATGFRPVYEISCNAQITYPHVRALVRSAVQSPAAHRIIGPYSKNPPKIRFKSS